MEILRVDRKKIKRLFLFVSMETNWSFWEKPSMPARSDSILCDSRWWRKSRSKEKWELYALYNIHITYIHIEKGGYYDQLLVEGEKGEEMNRISEDEIESVRGGRQKLRRKRKSKIYYVSAVHAVYIYK